jgi:hypothetical protein
MSQGNSEEKALSEVLSRHWGELINRQNVLSVGLGKKFTAGRDTGIEAIVVFVVRKVAATDLAAEHLIPPLIEGVPTDVIELRPDGWTAGNTVLSRMHPDEVKRRMGLRDKPSPKAIRLTRPAKTPSGAANWTAWASLIQDQMNCGCCVAHGNIGVWEACIRILRKNPNDPIKLSEAFPFFCTPGAGCDTGSDPQSFLDQCVKGGTVPESCLPFVGSPASQGTNQGCTVGACPNYPSLVIKLKGWTSITNPTEIKSLLDAGPLNCTMAVHQSFFNYTGGIYKNLGAMDPIAGYHDIGCFGYNDAKNYKIIRNSWSVAWAQNCVIDGVARPGYCMIDPAELDPEMQELVPMGGGNMTTRTFAGTLMDLSVTPNGPVPNQPVGIQVTNPDGSAGPTLSTTSGADGTYSVSQDLPDGTGYKAIMAFYGATVGNDVYDSSVSPVVVFDNPLPPPPPPPPPVVHHKTASTLTVS